MLLGIFFSQLGLLCISSPLTLWFFLVLATLCTCGWLKSFLPSSVLVLYFIISVMGSLFCLLASVPHPISAFLLTLGLTLIIGLAPFHFWILPALNYFFLPSLVFFLGPMKLGYLFLLTRSSSSPLILPFFSFMVGALYLFSASQLSLVLYSSGAIQVFILCLLGSHYFWPYQLVYLCSRMTFVLLHLGLASPLFCFLCLLGLPPLGMFWAKYLCLTILPALSGFLLLVVSALLTYPYLRVAVGIPVRVHTSFLVISALIVFPVSLSL